VSVLREFCPQCGTPMDEGLRTAKREHERGGDRPPQELKQNRKTFLIAAGSVLLLLAAAGKFDWGSRVIHFDSDEPKHRTVTIDADDLAKAYSVAADVAAKRFSGKEMVVTGEFLRLVPDGYGSLDMRLKTSDADAPLGVDLADVAIADAKKLRPGQEVTVSCHGIAGSGNDRWLQDCAVQPTEDADEAIPTPPAPPAPPPPPGKGKTN
jgi:hypothetical protein